MVSRSLLGTDFVNPAFRGYRIAYCLDDAKSGCGQDAADRFCKAQVPRHPHSRALSTGPLALCVLMCVCVWPVQTPSCGHASSFNMVAGYGGPTFQQGDGRVKGPGTNDAFDKIVRLPPSHHSSPKSQQMQPEGGCRQREASTHLCSVCVCGCGRADV